MQAGLRPQHKTDNKNHRPNTVKHVTTHKSSGGNAVHNNFGGTAGHVGVYPCAIFTIGGYDEHTSPVFLRPQSFIVGDIFSERFTFSNVIIFTMQIDEMVLLRAT